MLQTGGIRLSQPANIRVLIADDKELDREGVKALLHNQPDIEIVGTADSPTSVAPLVRQYQPDVILLDLHWHGNRRAGEQIIHDVRGVSHTVRIIAHSQYPELVEAAADAGADVAVTKTYDRGQLVSLIRGAVGQVPQHASRRGRRGPHALGARAAGASLYRRG